VLEHAGMSHIKGVHVGHLTPYIHPHTALSLAILMLSASGPLPFPACFPLHVWRQVWRRTASRPKDANPSFAVLRGVGASDVQGRCT
jgi:hypothetical protein